MQLVAAGEMEMPDQLKPRRPAPFPPPAPWPELDYDLRMAVQFAKQEAYRLGAKEVDAGHLFVAILKRDRTIGARILADAGLTLRSLRDRGEELRQLAGPRPA
jgi:hypothetical protein